MMLTIGLAMLQGARHEHAEALRGAAAELSIDVEIRELRKASDVEGIDALILPGGESTSMKIASRYENLYSAIWEIVESGIPVLGTCAGAILLCQQKLISAKIDRNAFGRQIDSFQASLKVDLGESLDGVKVSAHERDAFGHKPLDVGRQAAVSKDGFPGVFIRAPRFTSIKCDSIAFLDDEVVGIKQDNIVAVTFHPELSNDRRFHRWLILQCDDETKI